MLSKRAREGYMLIDHRNSPGVNPELIRASGLDAPVVGKNELFESATLLCGHCQAVVVLNPDRSRPRNWCSVCDHYVCDNPWCNTGGCKSFARRLSEAYEQSMRNQNV